MLIWLQNTTICERYKSKLLVIHKNSQNVTMCLLKFQKMAYRNVSSDIESLFREVFSWTRKILEYNTTKHVTALSKIECVSYCVLSHICCSVSYNDVSSQCVLDQSSCCDVQTSVEHNAILLENGYMDFILANHTEGMLIWIYLF